MSEYYHVLESEKTNQGMYSAIVDNQSAVQYIINPEEQQIQTQAQPILVRTDQYMVVDNQAIAFQNQPFQTHYYMDTEQKIQSPQPILLNNQGTQKLIMLQQSPPQMVIQQPVVQRQIQIPIQQSPPKQIGNVPRVILAPQASVITTPRTPNRMNVIRGAITRPPAGIQNVGLLRGGVGRASTARPMLKPLSKSSPGPAQPSPRQLVQRTRASTPQRPANQNNEGSRDVVALEDGRVVTVAEYQQMQAEKKKALEGRATQRQSLIKTPQQSSQLETTTSSTQTTQESQRTPRIIQQNGKKRMPAILRNFVPPPEISDIIKRTEHTAEFQNSVRMFVQLVSGEQRLITFTTPKEDCTIQEILEQVNVPLQADTNISVFESNKDGINLVVAVGFSDDDEDESDSSTQSQVQRDDQKARTPELQTNDTEAPKYVPGYLAVCTHCGFLSDDFNKCVRCKNKVPEGARRMAANNTLKDDPKKPSIAINLKNNKSLPQGAKRKPPARKVIEQEPVVLTLSSDEEDNADDNKQVEQPINNAIIWLKEPSIKDIKEHKGNPKVYANDSGDFMTAFECRTIKIGNYRFNPEENLIINKKELIIHVPLPKNTCLSKIIRIERRHVVRVLATFNKTQPLLFYYINEIQAATIRHELEMLTGSEPYFDPVSEDESVRRITLIPEVITEECRSLLKKIYDTDILEISSKDSNKLLMKTCSKDMTKFVQTQATPSTPNIVSSSSDVKQLFIYPPGKGGIAVNSEDYLCLAQEQFLNDVIIDFYLKYLVNQLPPEKQQKVHVFSTFFYNRLTTKPMVVDKRTNSETDTLLSAPEKRHARVKNWTKKINIFEKDFVIIPINENAHWFLSIICFPGMDGPHTFDGRPYTITGKQTPAKKAKPSLNTTITKTEKLNISTDDKSDKDEAEGDESELDSSEEAEEPVTPTVNKNGKVPYKQPCILIFDSLAGASRASVVATLRDYLTWEYKAKYNKQKVFDKNVIKGSCPKIPQQTNYTDCGLYLLQYVEQFLTNPLKDYQIPIHEMKAWFDEMTVTKKREDLSNLIKKLMVSYHKDVNILPNILLPTLNGELVEQEGENDEAAFSNDEEEEAEEEEEGDEDEVEKELIERESLKSDQSMETSLTDSGLASIKRNYDNNDDEGGITIIKKQKSNNDSGDSLKAMTKRDTMSYLKAKRIARHQKSNISSDTTETNLHSMD